MAILDSIKATFRGKKSIDKVTRDELRIEKIRLDQQEAKYVQRASEVEKEKERLFQQGMNESSQRKQTIVARKIKELDEQGKHLDGLLRACAHQIRVVNGLLMIKDDLGVMARDESTMLSKIPLEELASYIERATVQGEFQRGRLSEVLGVMEEGRGVATDLLGREDKDVQDIVKIFQQARDSAEADPVMAVETGLQAVDKVLNKEKASGDPA